MPPRARRSTVLAGLVNWLVVPAACLLSMAAMYLTAVLPMAAVRLIGAPEAVDPAVSTYRFGLLAGTLRVAGCVLGAWLAILGILFLAGVVLSRLTLAAIKRSQSAEALGVTQRDRVVRLLYRTIITVMCAYFYLSVPLLFLVGITVPAVVCCLLLIASNDVILPIIIGSVATYNAVALVRSALAARHGSEGEPSRRLAREEAPQLWAIADEVAQRVGTRPVDVICVTAWTSIAVAEYGSLRKKLRGDGVRWLFLGLGVLPGMTQRQLRAILAHEYAHFHHGDALQGLLEAHTRSFMDRVADALTARGKARWHNPVWLFIVGYHRVFLTVTLGASRLQEVLADHCATVAYGAGERMASLLHLVRQDCAFNVRLANGYVVGLYSDSPVPEPLQPQLDEAIEKEMSRGTTVYDSHPSPQDRLRLVEPPPSDDHPEDSAPVWDLLPEVEELQRGAVEVVREHLRWQREWREYLAARRRRRQHWLRRY